MEIINLDLVPYIHKHMDPNILYKVKSSIEGYAKLVGKKAYSWTFTYNHYEFDVINNNYYDLFELSEFFKECLDDADLETVLEYIRESTIIDPYKDEILDYLLSVRKSCVKDRKMDDIFDRLDNIEKMFYRMDDMVERLNQIDDRFKIIIDMMDSAKSN